MNIKDIFGSLEGTAHSSADVLTDPVGVDLVAKDSFVYLDHLDISLKLFTVLDVGNELSDKFIGIEGSHIALVTRTHRDDIVVDLVVTDYEHIGDLLKLCFADLVTGLFGTGVHFATDTLILHSVHQLFAEFVVTVCDRQDLDLNGSKPCRELTCKVLGKDAYKALDGAEYDAVDHDRTVTLVVCADILGLKALRKLEVELNGSALPGTADGIFKVEVDLGTVECAVALVYDVLKVELVKITFSTPFCRPREQTRKQAMITK